MHKVTITCPICDTHEITVTVRESEGQSYFNDGHCQKCGIVSGALMMKPGLGGVVQFVPKVGSHGTGDRLKGI
jgi:uncharacterized Zn finger protein